MPCGSPIKDVDEVVKEVEMVHLGRQCERIEHSCPFGSLMRTEEERAPSGHGEVAVHPFDEIVVKCSVASLEDVDYRLTFDWLADDVPKLTLRTVKKRPAHIRLAGGRAEAHAENGKKKRPAQIRASLVSFLIMSIITDCVSRCFCS